MIRSLPPVEFGINNPSSEFFKFLRGHKNKSTSEISPKEFKAHFNAYLNLMNVACKEMKWGKLNYDDTHIENNLFLDGRLRFPAYYKLHIFALNKSAQRIFSEIEDTEVIKEYFPLLMDYCADSCKLIQGATNHFYEIKVSYGLYGTNTSTTYEIYKAADIALKRFFSEEYIGTRLLPKVAVFFIRQAIELRLNKIFGIHLLWDKNRKRPIKGHLTRKVLKLMKDNADNIILPVRISTLEKISKWTNWYIHTGIHAPEYITEWALHILKPLFSAGQHKTLQSMHGSVKIKKSFYDSAIVSLEKMLNGESNKSKSDIMLLKDSDNESIVVSDEDWEELKRP